MTKAQYKVLGRLRKKQTNRSDLEVVDATSTSCTIFLPFPGLYLSYDNDGKLYLTETIKERMAGKKAMKGSPLLAGEMADGVYNKPTVYDDDIPF